MLQGVLCSATLRLTSAMLCAGRQPKREGRLTMLCFRGWGCSSRKVMQA